MSLSYNALRVVGESARFTVSGCVAATLLTRQDTATLEWVVGAICASAFNKVLKKIIKQSRPEGSLQTGDDGMPSSHACAMCNIATSALADQPWQICLGAGLYVATALTWRRVARYHTTPQLVVGAAVGVATSLAWGNARPLYRLIGDGGDVPILLISLVLVAGAVVIGSFERRKERVE